MKILKICDKYKPKCEQCPLYMKNDIYNMMECAIHPLSNEIRDEYRKEVEKRIKNLD